MIAFNPILAHPFKCILVKFRSKRKTETIRRKKIRPCLKVCQKVEEQCPYLLPGDRAPGYNTQYAGEPTFLCKGILDFIHNMVDVNEVKFE